MPPSREHERPRSEPGIDPDECAHHNLAKVESDVNEVDTDVLLYQCPACRKTFTITDY